jgi:protoporphyrinogen oxidase
MPTRHVPIAILGAGLTGLCAARTIRRARGACRVFERSRHVGGHASTITDQGYRFDCTGHLLHLRSDALRDEVLELLDGACSEIDRNSVVFSNGVMTPYPFQAHTHGLPPQVAYECLLGFLAAVRQPPAEPPQNFEEYCLRHFGAGFSRHFMLPYNRRLFGVPLDQITTEWCERFVPRPKLEDVIAGAVGLENKQLGYNSRFLYPKLGIGELPRALARSAGDISFDAALVELRPERRELVIGSELVRYRTLVSSLPLTTLLDSIRELPSEVAAARKRLRVTELRYLDVALAAPAKRDFHWAYVPEERFPFYRVGQYSAFSQEMAPSGGASLYVELVDRKSPDLSQLVPEVLAGLCELGVIQNASDVRFVRARHLEQAYVLYDAERAPALSVIEPFLESIGVISTGRYGAWNYSSMEDAIRFGTEAAERALVRS